MAGDDDVTIRIRADNQTGPGMAGVRRDVNGALRDIRGRFVADTGAMTQAAASTAAAIGQGGASGGGGGLSGALTGLGAAAGLSVLPAIGALVPMLAGAGLAAVTAKVAFAGVGDAVALAGSDAEAYAEALEKMGPEQREFTKTIVSAKKEFAGFGKEIQAIALPGFTAGLKAAAPAADTFKGAMKDMAGVLGDLGKDAGAFIGSTKFRDSLKANFELGAGFVDKFARSLGPFTQSLLDFGAASEPTLDALTDGLSGLMDTGLPGFFEGLEQGISGSADMFDGLFGAVNRVLPSFGELAGATSKAFGPVFKELFIGAGDRGAAGLDLLAGAAKAAAPILKDLAFGLKLSNDLFRILGGSVKDAAGVIIDSFLPATSEIDKMRGPFQRLYGVFRENRGAIEDGARQFSNFIVGVAEATATHLPTAFSAFRLLGTTVLDVMGTIVNGASDAFGWIPGIGDRVKEAAGTFNIFAANAREGLDKAGRTINEFSASALPKLRENKLRMNIDQWEDQIRSAKERLKSVPPSKQSKLKGEISDLRKKVAAGKRELASLPKSRSTTWRFRKITENIVRTSYTFRGGSFLGSTAGRLAHGGIVGNWGRAATGGPRSNMTLVGEQGPELVDLAPGSMVHTAGATRRMMQQQGGGRGDGRPIQVNLILDGKVVARQIIDPLRHEIGALGGNVQSALGRRGR